MFQRNVLLGSLLLLAACPSSPTPTPETKGAGAKVEAVPTNPCPASASWISNPSMPTDVPADPSNCDFHQFAWQSFLYLVNPATPPALTFETFMADAGIFVPSGQTPTPYGQPAPQGGSCPTGAKLQLRQADRTSGGSATVANAGELGDIFQAGSAEPLVDQANRFVHYGVSYNQTQYDYLTTCDLYREACFDQTLAPGGATSSVDFPAGSTELKTAWHVVETCNLPDSPKPCTPEDASDFYTTTAVVEPYSASDPSCVAVTVALVGMHVVTKTPLHPEWIWATFEHVDNAPDCANPSEKPPEGGWTFYDPTCTGTACTPNTYVNGCGKDEYDPTCKTQVPIQVCREAAVGAGTTGNAENVLALNAGVMALLPKGSVWNNYELVGTLWLDQSQPVPPERGSSFLANTTAETYVQSVVTDATPTNCLTCHTPGPASSPTSASFGASADGSHAFAGIQNTDACPTDLPTTCPTAPPATAAVVPAAAPTGAGTPAVPAAK
jgi:hypothetical protein